MPTIYETATEVFDKLQKSPVGQDLLKKYDQTFLLEVTDEEPFVVEIKGGRVTLRKKKIPWPPRNRQEWLQNSWMKADKETFLALFEGKIGPMAAYYLGKLRLSGLVSDVKQPVDAWMFKLMLGGKTRPINLEQFKPVE